MPKQYSRFASYPSALKALAPRPKWRAICDAIHDGDTAFFLVDVGFWELPLVTVRFSRINAPELSTPAGQIALAGLLTLLQPGMPVVLTVEGFDTYDRAIASIATETLPDLSQAMLDHGWAAVYPPAPKPAPAP